MALSKEESKKEIKRLVEKYNRLIQSGDSKKLTEEETKKDFILPLFHALNWDTQNSKEVSAEETISKKRVDYGFRIDGIPKFFLEAKPFKEKLQFEYAEQAINYSWLKSTTWAVLTNFDELKIFNAEWKSRSIVDKLFFELKWSEFEEKFDKLWLLSKDSFLKNELDRTAEEWGKKQRKTPVTPVIKQLFDDLMVWRQKLTKNISGNRANMGILRTEEALDESVQRVLDRLIFIRVCEDREIEPVTLLPKLREWKGIERKGKLFIHLMNDVFREFDKNYNSKLFSKHPCEELIIDDIILNDIIHGLYENSDKTFKYDFSAIDADVLGNIYEEYLGYVLKKGKATENGMHRKEMGIYYTPTFVVDYIVKNTLGKLLEEKGDGKIKILDPACGSGSFLIKAFDHLLEYHKKYSEKNLETFLRKIKILTDNIHGVDLDSKAVEIAQLNLLLRAVEKRRILPTLQNNIKIGNSLIDDSEIVGDRAFDWNKEFQEVIKNGGFDVVIGNPPYGAELSETERQFISKSYEKSKSYKNTALIFIEKGLSLLKNGGYLGLIVPKSLTFSQEWKAGRELIKDHLGIIVDVSKAFENVLLEQVIIVLKKNSKSKNYMALSISPFKNEESLIEKSFIDKTDSIIVHGDKKDFEVFKKMNSQNMFLSDISKTRRGIPLQKYATKNKSKCPIIRGRNISRFSISESDEYLPDSIIDRKNQKIKSLLNPKIVSQRIVAHVTKPNDHLIIMSAFDKDGKITVDTVENTIITDNSYSPEFLVCLLNSKLISWYAYRYIFSKAIRTMDLDDYYIGKIPIPQSKMITKEEFNNLYYKLRKLHESLNEVSKDSDKGKKLQEEIQKTDNEIDRKLYELYGLTKEEIEIVGNS